MPTSILHQRRALLDDLAKLLLVTETIDGPDLQAYASGEKAIPTPDEARADLEEKRRAAAIVAKARREPTSSRPAPAPLLPPAPPLPAD